MTTPNNEPPSPAIPFALSGTGSIGDGSGSITAADLGSLTQDAIMALLGQSQIQESPGWTASSTSAYSGLTPGIPYALAIIEQFVSQVTGLPAGTWTTVNDAIEAMDGISSNADLQANWTTFLTGIGLSSTDVAGLVSLINSLSVGITGFFQALVGSNTQTGLLGEVPSTAVTNTSGNAQLVSNFPNAESIEAEAGWSWDGTTTYTAPVTGAVSYSVKFTASGVQGEAAGVVSPVQPGQVCTPAAQVQWSGLSAASGTSPIRLQLVPGYIAPFSTVFQPAAAVTIAEVTSPASSASWTSLTGTYDVPTDGSVNAVQLQLTVTDDATVGSIWWAACTNDITGGFLPNLLAALTTIIDSLAPGGTAAEFSTGIANLLQLFGLTSGNILTSTDASTVWNNVIAGIINPLNAIEAQADNVIVGISNDLTDVLDNVFGSGADPTTAQALSAVLPGLGGPTDLVSTVQATWDYIENALTGGSSVGNGLAQVSNAQAAVAGTASSAQALAQSATLTQAQQTQAKSFYTAMDTTVDATFQLAHAFSLASMPTITVTAAASVIGYIVCQDNVTKLSVPFVAEIVGTLTAVYINIYTVNPSTGLCTNLVDSSNIVSEIGTTEALVYYDLATGIAVAPGDMYAIEVVVVGSGSLTMMGFGPTWMPTNPLVNPAAAVGGKRSISAAYNAVGVGVNSSSTSTTITKTESHTAALGADVIVFAGVNSTGAPTAVAWTATYNGVSMGSPIETIDGDNIIGQGQLACFRLAGAGTGNAETVSVSAAVTGVSGDTQYLTIGSVSYLGISGVGAITTNYAAAVETMGLSPTGVAGDIVVACFIEYASTLGTLSLAAGPTERYIVQQIAGGPDYGMVICDDSATGALTLTANNTTAAGWAGIAIVLEGSSSSAPSTFTPVPSTSIPWLGLSSLGGTIAPQYAPETSPYPTSGTWTPPSWFQAGGLIDYILLGAGGAGSLSSRGGSAGAWLAGTLVYGTDVKIGSAITITDGTGGAGSSLVVPGNDGTATTLVYTDPSNTTHTLTAAGGLGGDQSGQSWANLAGQSPGTEMYNGFGYFGGAQQNSSNGSGYPPGGGGAYGNSNGANGAGWIVARQP